MDHRDCTGYHARTEMARLPAGLVVGGKGSSSRRTRRSWPIVCVPGIALSVGLRPGKCTRPVCRESRRSGLLHSQARVRVLQLGLVGWDRSLEDRSVLVLRAHPEARSGCAVRRPGMALSRTRTTVCPPTLDCLREVLSGVR